MTWLLDTLVHFNSVRYKPNFNISKCAFQPSETVPSGIKYISNVFDPLEMQGDLMLR